MTRLTFRAPSRARRRTTRTALLLGLASAMLAVFAANAAAVLVHLPGGRTVSVQPLRGAAIPAIGTSPGPLTYHGGPIMPSNTNYTIYWQPSGAPAYPAEYQSGINKYLEDLAHDSGGSQNVDSVATQYKDAAGQFANYNSHFGGALIDTDPYPANGCSAATICFTDEQLRAEIKHYVETHGLPRDLTHEYFLLTPPTVEDCIELTACSAGSKIPIYCAYHGNIPATAGVIIYSNDPYVTGNSGCDDGEHPNNKPSDGALQGGLSHEHNESITDPELNAWSDSEGNENGDKCRTGVEASEFGTPLGKAPDGSRYNQVVNSDLYWYQQEWSNEGNQCKQRRAAGAPALSVSRLEPTSGPKAGGTTVTITGTGFAPGKTAFKFGATNATGVSCASSTSCTAVSPKRTKTGKVDVVATVAGKSSPKNPPADQFTYV